MTPITKRFTLEEYLTHDDGTDTCYELVNGEVIAIGIETGRHGKIIRFLCQNFEADCDRFNCISSDQLNSSTDSEKLKAAKLV